MSSNRLIQPVFSPLFLPPYLPPSPSYPTPKPNPLVHVSVHWCFPRYLWQTGFISTKGKCIKRRNELVIKGNTNLECPKRRQKIQLVQHTRFNCSWPQITSTRVGHSSKEVLVILRNKYLMHMVDLLTCAYVQGFITRRL